MQPPISFEKLQIHPNRQGNNRYLKSSHPVRYGLHTEVRCGDYLLHYNRRGQIKTISGLGDHWPHPAEWLKRSLGNHWLYYSTGDYYSGVVDLLGEYYQPCPAYPTNSLHREDPFARPAVQAAIDLAARLPAAFSELRARLDLATSLPGLRDFLEQAERQTARQRAKDAEQLERIIDATINVLPPDCRHVDYDVIPLIVSEGCLYNCGFCSLKTQGPFRERSRQEIQQQLHGLHAFFGEELQNYNSLFLGQHDALATEAATILWTAEQAYQILAISDSFMQEPRLFLFGSVDSFLGKENAFFQALDQLPWQTHINLGLESFDDITLTMLRKPVPAARVKEAFCRMMELNQRLAQVAISANFVLGEALPDSHHRSLKALLADRTVAQTSRATIYLSPLIGENANRLLLEQFREIKRTSRPEVFLYLIQRL